MNARKGRASVCVWGILTLLTPLVAAQSARSPQRPLAANVIVPQSRAFAVDSSGSVQITGVNVGVVIVEQVATTTMDISLRNPGRSRAEAELIVPVPDGAVVRGFAFDGSAAEPTAALLPKDEARHMYDTIVAKIRDPALLEFIGYNLIRSSVFPIAAGGTQKVRLTYEQLLPRDGARIDYELPRSESLEYNVPWNITVKIKSKTPISTAYSPSHNLDTTRGGPHDLSVRITSDAATVPGPFRLSYLLAANGVSASLLAYPDPQGGGGYFLLLAGLPAEPLGGPVVIRREITLVIDHSGSMRGGKLDQAREAAMQVLAGLEEGEAFNIIVYNDTVKSFSARPVIKTAETEHAAREYLNRLRAGGGTNIHDALLAALQAEPTAEMLPIVLFLTDGLPTVGQTSETAIRKVASEQNPSQRRIFTFGVGVDVNTPLLQKIATETRAKATFVLPKEDVEVKVAQVFKGLKGPILTAPALDVVTPLAGPPITRITEVMPSKLPDLFEGDQLVVLGRYFGSDPLDFVFRGDYFGRPREFHFSFPLDQATTRNAFVPRLWASRRIAHLIDTIRQMGADPSVMGNTYAVADDPKLNELTEEIVRLSTEFGILTEYTAFLAREGMDLSKRDEVMAEANGNFQKRAMATRSGMGSVNQTMNLAGQAEQQTLNRDNTFYDENMNRVAITAVQQVNDLAFFQRGNRWVDSRVVERENEAEPRRVIAFGTAEFAALADHLASENRQGLIALRGDILVIVGDELVLVKGPTAD
ncbi:MAG: VWA domain-containing protein [Phycisphaerae bacterium]|nr:VWA domain-containing protein [Phycisphaerae bacterium]